MRYTVSTSDSAGKPVAAELSLDVVDKAILTLLPRDADVLRRAFYGERGLGINTSSGLSASADRLLEKLLERLAAQNAANATGSAGAAGGMDGEVVAEAAPAADASMDVRGRRRRTALLPLRRASNCARTSPIRPSGKLTL